MTDNCHHCGIEFEPGMLRYWWEDEHGLPDYICEVCEDRDKDNKEVEAA